IGAATAARRTVAVPDAVSVQRAPRAAMSGPPIAVPSGVATMTAALRAASTLGRFFVVVIDWKRAEGSGTNAPDPTPPMAKQIIVTGTGATANGSRQTPQPATIRRTTRR